ncbi:MAG: DUF512 domain-containing protein [Chloroflexi bacterium]|nr:DUF512 domain-containing protein [Chloroflexota bacterium]
MPPLEAYDGQALQENGLGQVRGFLDEWEGIKTEIEDQRVKEGGDLTSIFHFQSLTLVTATLFAPVLAEKAAEFAQLTGVSVTVLPVINKRLGDTITVAGLLMGLDVLEALQAPVAEPVEVEPVEVPHLFILPASCSTIPTPSPWTTFRPKTSPIACKNRWPWPTPSAMCGTRSPGNQR